MKVIDKLIKRNNSDYLLNEKTDIDYNLNRPGLFKYYILSSIRWIISYWYITFPVILVFGFIGLTAGVQYIQGNDKPVWGVRANQLPENSRLISKAEQISKTDLGYSHFKVYISGPEIHIEIGLNSKDVKDYTSAKNNIKNAYKLLLSDFSSSERKLINKKYSVIAIVAGVNPAKTTTNLHAVLAKNEKTFTFYHK